MWTSFPCTFLLKSRFLFIFLLRSLLSLYFSIEIWTFFLLFLCTSFHAALQPTLCFAHANFYAQPLSIPCSAAAYSCVPQCNYAHVALRGDRAATSVSNHYCIVFTTARSCLLWKRSSHSSSLSNFHIVPRLPHKLQPLHLATSWLSYSLVSYLWATAWLLYLLTELFKCELPLDYSTSWLSYPIFRTVTELWKFPTGDFHVAVRWGFLLFQGATTLRFQWLDMGLDVLWLMERVLAVLTTSYLAELLTVRQLFSTFLALNGAVEMGAIFSAAGGAHIPLETFALFHAINCLRALQSFEILSKFRGPQLLLTACRSFAHSLPPGFISSPTQKQQPQWPPLSIYICIPAAPKTTTSRTI